MSIGYIAIANLLVASTSMQATTTKKAFNRWGREYFKDSLRHFGRQLSSFIQLIWCYQMYGCESWTIKKAEHQRIDGFELRYWRRLLRVHWTTRRSNQSILEENQSWIFIRRINTEAEAPILWPPDVKSWVIKNLFIHFPDVGKDWRQEKKGTTEDEMVGWHLWLNGHEFE